MNEKQKNTRVIAYYLPQFHPIPQNDEWWGKGFTEWTNTAKAKPLYKGHYQPHVPADLGFYDLRVPETREAQADMAREYGIEGFCYWHYWFGGNRLLERPFDEVLASRKPDFPFCLAWANQTWTGIWHGTPNRTLIEQTYPGIEDYKNHFYMLLKAFSDDRYITVDGKPLFSIYWPVGLPDCNQITDLWRELALNAGLKGLYLVGESKDPNWIPQDHGFDAAITLNFSKLRYGNSWHHPLHRLKMKYHNLLNLPRIYNYEELLKVKSPNLPSDVEAFPTIMPNWDNTPRSGKNGIVLQGSTPELFRLNIQQKFAKVADRPLEHRIVFAKSWNEWAEGNHLEPDMKYGMQYLEVLRDEIFK